MVAGRIPAGGMVEYEMPDSSELSFKQLFILWLSAALVGGSGTAGLFKLTDPQNGEVTSKLISTIDGLSKNLDRLEKKDYRPNPYTSLDGDRDRAQSEERDRANQIQIEALKTELNKIRETISKHDIEASRWKERILNNARLLDRMETHK